MKAWRHETAFPAYGRNVKAASPRLENVEEVEENDNRDWDSDQPQYDTAHGSFLPHWGTKKAGNLAEHGLFESNALRHGTSY